MMELASNDEVRVNSAEDIQTSGSRKALLILRASEEERSRHLQQLAAIQEESKGRCLWLSSEKTI